MIFNFTRNFVTDEKESYKKQDEIAEESFKSFEALRSRYESLFLEPNVLLHNSNNWGTVYDPWFPNENKNNLYLKMKEVLPTTFFDSDNETSKLFTDANSIIDYLAEPSKKPRFPIDNSYIKDLSKHSKCKDILKCRMWNTFLKKAYDIQARGMGKGELIPHLIFNEKFVNVTNTDACFVDVDSYKVRNFFKLRSRSTKKLNCMKKKSEEYKEEKQFRIEREQAKEELKTQLQNIEVKGVGAELEIVGTVGSKKKKSTLQNAVKDVYGKCNKKNNTNNDNEIDKFIKEKDSNKIRRFMEIAFPGECGVETEKEIQYVIDKFKMFCPKKQKQQREEHLSFALLHIAAKNHQMRHLLLIDPELRCVIFNRFDLSDESFAFFQKHIKCELNNLSSSQENTNQAYSDAKIKIAIKAS